MAESCSQRRKALRPSSVVAPAPRPTLAAALLLASLLSLPFAALTLVQLVL
ncbi:hypothetical protein [Salipiger sp.]|uniref:hypothetical protein n=1 Tax=Salipiger sp. TaxID=2078585 RepID=UPI003A98795A